MLENEIIKHYRFQFASTTLSGGVVNYGLSDENLAKDLKGVNKNYYNWGFIKVSRHLLETCPQEVREIFNRLRFIPYGVIHGLNNMTYTGKSERFERLKESEQFPEYTVIVHTEQGKIKDVEVHRKE